MHMVAFNDCQDNGTNGGRRSSAIGRLKQTMVSCIHNTGITSQDPEILQHHSLTSLFTAFFKPDIPLEPLLLSL